MDKLTQAREALIAQIDSLLAMNKTGQVSHRVPGLAVDLLTRSRDALAALSDGEAVEPVADRDRQLSQASHGAVRVRDGSETLTDEFRRLVSEYREPDTDGTRNEAWNLIADFAVENANEILASLEPAAPGREEAIPLGESHDAELSICRALDCLRNDLTQEAFEQLNDALIAVRASPPTGKDAVQAVTWEDVRQAGMWTGEGDGFKSFTLSAKVAKNWRKSGMKVTPYAALQQKETGR